MVLRNPSCIFPIELLELVIDNLQIYDDDDDRKSLISCSYANRVLCIICQKSLFQYVVVTHGIYRKAVTISFFDDKQSTGYRFLRLLDASPHIGSYVRNITLSAVYLDMVPSSDTTSSRDPNFSFYAISSRLQNLQEFDIEVRGNLPWSRLDEPTKTFLRNLTQSVPVLDFFPIEDIPISLFYNCAALQELCLSSFEGNGDPAPVLHTRAQLRALEVWHASRDLAPNELLSWFQPASSPFDLTHLVDLALLSGRYLVSDIQSMLKLCSNTLEKLDLCLGYLYEVPFDMNGFTPKSEPEATPPNLGSLRQMRHLILQTSISDTGELCCSDIPFASSILKTLSYDVHCPPFKLTLDIDLYKYAIDRLSTFPWFILVNVLCGNQIWPHLAGVEFRFCQQMEHTELEFSPQNLASSLDQNEDLSKLRRRGLLSYTCS